jgi:hypothetical protein
MPIGGVSFSQFASLMLSWGTHFCNWKEIGAGTCIASTTNMLVGGHFGRGITVARIKTMKDQLLSWKIDKLMMIH